MAVGGGRAGGSYHGVGGRCRRVAVVEEAQVTLELLRVVQDARLDDRGGPTHLQTRDPDIRRRD